MAFFMESLIRLVFPILRLYDRVRQFSLTIVEDIILRSFPGRLFLHLGGAAPFLSFGHFPVSLGKFTGQDDKMIWSCENTIEKGNNTKPNLKSHSCKVFYPAIHSFG